MKNRIKCNECGKTQAHPMCCDKPMGIENTSWVCKHCERQEQITCCDKPMTPEEKEDVDLPDDVVQTFEKVFNEVEDKKEEKEKEDAENESEKKEGHPDYIG